MTPRPSFTASSKRPLSAIFLGSSPSFPPNGLGGVPDLPEPPSPGAESNHSGLPSPPATNSTGSGSTGDDTTTSIRPRPASLSNSTMSNGNYAKTLLALRRHKIAAGEDDDDDDDDNQNDDDNTAKLDLPHHNRSSSENVLALQRVKSLTQRNRMAISKLSSFSRLKSPSPLPPAPPTASSSSASSSSKSSTSRISSHSHTQSLSESRRDDYRDHPQSGSETERESSHNPSSNSASYDPSATPSRSASALGLARQRRISAPDSPSKGVARSTGAGSPTRARGPRKRVSMAMSETTPERYEERERDVTSAALAAVASSRRSPSGGKRTRQPLPPQFRDDQRSAEPSTPYVERSYTGSSSSPRASTSAVSFAIQPQSPRGPRQYRSSTVRLPRHHQTRWLSEDLGSTISGDREADEDRAGQSGTRQTQRGGSAESPLTGRSLVGEGLRAAGLTKRRDEDDVFEHASGAGRASEMGRGGQRVSPTTARDAGAGWAADGNADESERDRDRDFVRSRSQASGLLNARFGEGGSRTFDPRTPENDAGAKRGVFGGGGSAGRPATSMAEFRHGEDAGRRPRTAPGGELGTFKPAYPAERERERERGAVSALSRHPTPQHQQTHDRQYSSPFGSRRYNTTPLPGGSPAFHQQQNNASEHTRLMMESLSMFESHLSRVPPMGTTSTVTIPELFRSAQGIVHASDKLNTQLRAGTSRALEEQVSAEIGDAADGAAMAEVWRRVGGEYREGLRVSDELVRTLTGFILGVGKVLRETTAAAAAGGGDGGHGRTQSLDDELHRRLSPDVGGSGSGSGGRMSVDGRRSVESRRSWEPLSRDQVHADALRRLSNRVEGRPPLGAGNSVSDPPHDSPALTARPTSRAMNTTSTWARRLVVAPREPREEHQDEHARTNGMLASDSLETLRGYEPSPTPSSRQPRVYLNSTLPPLSIPPPLPALPSESVARRQPPDAPDKNASPRRKPSTNASALAARANPLGMPPFSAVSTPTTALTPHTVSNSPERSSFPLLRSVSGSSARSGVTFSKPSTISVSALAGLQQQQQRDTRKRTISATSSNANEPSSSAPGPAVLAAQVRTPLSGSETERDTRRKTIGTRSRVSLDSTVHANGRENSARAVVPSAAVRRERRRTVTEIFSQN